MGKPFRGKITRQSASPSFHLAGHLLNEETLARDHLNNLSSTASQQYRGEKWKKIGENWRK